MKNNFEQNTRRPNPTDKFRDPGSLLRKFCIAIAALACLLTSVPCARASGGGYLFATFRHEGINGEQIYFALSHDGRTWSALNQSKPFLVSQIGDKGVRDPYLLRMNDGKKFVLIATDLSIYQRKLSGKTGAEAWKESTTVGSRSLVIWESTDLVHWDGPRLAAVAPEDAGCAWAPEAVYDSESGDYMVFWASTTSSDHFTNQRIWASHTRDFQKFSTPVVYIERPGGVIDTTIVHDGDSYYRFSKDLGRHGITMESSPKLSGPWKEISDFSLGKTSGIEGPECYLLNSESEGAPKSWCLIVDFYAKSLGYRPFVSQDLKTGNFTEGQGFTFPFKFRHGTVLPITEQEYNRLEGAFPASTGKK